MKTRAKVTQKKYCPPTFAIRLKLSVLRAVSEGQGQLSCTCTGVHILYNVQWSMELWQCHTSYSHVTEYRGGWYITKQINVFFLPTVYRAMV